VKGKAEKAVGTLKDAVRDAKQTVQSEVEKHELEKKERLERERTETEHAGASHR
jgi:Sec-independent protein translocase protein TatA